MSRYTVVCRTRKYGVKAIITITILFILVLFEVLDIVIICQKADKRR